ncbi:soma ferritin-like [Teleopsis dalmanni]|uniref:soma ferritin-like n=1 Tax=Teleopsis dalmanni TaxID=139649 RepID=UPI0018CD1FC9|nr:soma ferritin-like [Teleopsis dalmanni]XP_037947916.1 soma ferritin-like [Teleopsis dalmanni]XP_037947917.1 soma ferritin-like [Teleopsis dalmanni]
MMKILVGLLLLSISSYAENLCSVHKFDEFSTFAKGIDRDEHSLCYENTIRQFGMEIDASYIYLSLGAYCAQDVVNRPGFADFFFKAAKTEREHAKKLFKYLFISNHLNKISPLMGKLYKTDRIGNGFDVFTIALELEEKMTQSIRELIKSCETDNKKSNIVGWLTNVYLEEHLHSIRDIAGKLSQLEKMGSESLSEFLFDKELNLKNIK